MIRRSGRPIYNGSELDYEHVFDAGGTFSPDGPVRALSADPSARIIEAIQHDNRVLDPNNVQAIGNAVNLLNPSQATGLGVPLNPFEGPNLDVTATTVVQAVAKVQDGPRNLLVTINPPGIPVGQRDQEGAALISIDIKARIYWGTGGTFAVADIDCLNGVQVTVQGNFVRVDGLYLVTRDVEVIPPMTLGATIGYGNRGASNTPPLWTRVDPTALETGATREIIIPSFAKDIIVYASEDIGAGIFISSPVQVGFSPGQGIAPTFVISQGADDAPIHRIPGGVPVIRLKNSNAFSIHTACVFGLAL